MMADTPVKPSLKKAGISKETIFWIVLALVVFGSITAYGGYKKFYADQEGQDRVIDTHTGQQNPWLSASLVGELPPAEPGVEEEEEVELPPAAPVQEEVKLPEAPPPANDMIDPYPTDNRIEKARYEYNEKRRGRVGIGSVDNPYGGSQAYDYVMSQESWPDEERIEASYPTRLDRTLTINKYIPAAIKPELCSELNGKVVAVVTENVYAFHGRNILIPMGSEAVGYYYPLSKIGQERLSVYFTRIITPEGINIHLTDGEMADALGRAGITGELDNQYLEKYGLPLLMTTLQLGANYMFPVENDSQRVVVEQYGTSVSNMGAKVLDETMQIKPVLTIPMASDIVISPMKDIWFPKPYKNKIKVQPAEG